MSEAAEFIDVDSEASVVQEEPPKRNEGPAYFSPERAEAKERIKMAFISGKATLAYMSRMEKIPHQTLMQWSSDEGWGELKKQVAEKSDSNAVENITDWITKEKTKQIKEGVSQGAWLRSLAKEAVETARRSESGLTPSDVQAVSTAVERADNVVRRNLGMDQGSGGGNSLSVNILSQSIHLS